MTTNIKNVKATYQPRSVDSGVQESNFCGSRNQTSVDIIIVKILKKLNRNKPTFKLGNKTDKFSFLLQDQLQSLCKINKLFV